MLSKELIRMSFIINSCSVQVSLTLRHFFFISGKVHWCVSLLVDCVSHILNLSWEHGSFSSFIINLIKNVLVCDCVYFTWSFFFVSTILKCTFFFSWISIRFCFLSFSFKWNIRIKKYFFCSFCFWRGLLLNFFNNIKRSWTNSAQFFFTITCLLGIFSNSFFS